MRDDKFDTRDREDVNSIGAPGKPKLKIRYMAHCCGYVMVRRPGDEPFIMREKTWLETPVFKKGTYN